MKYIFKSKIVAFSIVGAVIASGLFFLFYKDTSYEAISNFEGCKNAGYAILESYPEQCKTPDGRTFVNEAQIVKNPASSTTTPTSPVIGINETDVKVYNLVPNQIITSPLVIEGQARLWYFEASFPVELIDGNGKSIALAPATAQGDWMTTAFVPFKLTLTFAKPTTATGTLIFKNDNPSGLPENEKSFTVPVRFN